jgi:hypothetical protein
MFVRGTEPWDGEGLNLCQIGEKRHTRISRDPCHRDVEIVLYALHGAQQDVPLFENSFGRVTTPSESCFAKGL